MTNKLVLVVSKSSWFLATSPDASRELLECPHNMAAGSPEPVTQGTGWENTGALAVTLCPSHSDSHGLCRSVLSSAEGCTGHGASCAGPGGILEAPDLSSISFHPCDSPGGLAFLSSFHRCRNLQTQDPRFQCPSTHRAGSPSVQPIKLPVTTLWAAGPPEGVKSLAGNAQPSCLTSQHPQSKVNYSTDFMGMGKR